MGTLSRILRDIQKRNIEAAAGRIYSFSGVWEFVTEKHNIPNEAYAALETKKNYGWNGKDGKASFLTRDEDGKFIVLVKGPGTRCPNPEYRGIYPRGENSDLYWVPLRVCKKCPFHRSATREFRYPTCLMRAASNPKKEAAAETLRTFSDAVDRADKLMS